MTQPQEPHAGGEVVNLPEDHVAPGPVLPPPTPHVGAHGLIVTLMAAFALLGIGAMFAFITIKWPADAGRYLVGVFVFSIVGFVSCASIAVFTAARQMSMPPRRDDEDISRN